MLDYTRFLELGGNSEVPQEFFKKTEIEMLGWIDYYTFNRIDYEEPELKIKCEKTLLELIEYTFTESNEREAALNDEKVVKSETVGRHKVDYAVSDKGDRTSITQRLDAIRDTKIYETIKKHFGMTGLMYRGV